MRRLQNNINLKKHKPGEYYPEVNRRKCEGCGYCADNCPNGILEVRTLGDREKSQLPFIARLRVGMHGNRQVQIVNPDDCEGCGLCVMNCRHQAISLKRNVALK